MHTKVPQLRKERELSQEELGTAVGVIRQAIASIEIGKCVTFLPLVYKIAHYFDRIIKDVFDFINLGESK